MSSNNALVTIITPVYNGDRFIAEAIESVLTQSYQYWELIIINDDSTDSTEEIIKKYEDNRIQYFKIVKAGVGAARNVGLTKMKGAYFCFLDSDDVMPPNSLLSRLQVFSSNENIFFVDGVVEIYNKSMKVSKRHWSPSYIGNPLFDLISLTGNSFFGPSWMIKRKEGIKYHFNDKLTHGEDLLFYINLARYGGEYRYTMDSILRYRTGNETAMTNLKGLENGYWGIYNELLKMHDIPRNMIANFRKKIKSIMFKSYLVDFNLFRAISSLLK